MTAPTSHFSLVLETPAAPPEEAHRHFLAKLAVETDPADVRLDLQRGQKSFVLLDVRSAQDFEECHISGAINLPARRITAETTAQLSKEHQIVTYCWEVGCNGSTKAAARLSALGFRVKEMIGGIEYWRREGVRWKGHWGSRRRSFARKQSILPSHETVSLDGRCLSRCTGACQRDELQVRLCQSGSSVVRYWRWQPK